MNADSDSFVHPFIRHCIHPSMLKTLCRVTVRSGAMSWLMDADLGSLIHPLFIHSFTI